jgi:hypothetical protein
MDDDDMENRFRPLGMEQRNQREDDDTEERFSVSGAKNWGCQKDTYDETTVLIMRGGRVTLNPTDGVTPKMLTIAQSKGRAMMKEMTRSISRKGQHPPTVNDPPC